MFEFFFASPTSVPTVQPPRTSTDSTIDKTGIHNANKSKNPNSNSINSNNHSTSSYNPSNVERPQTRKNSSGPFGSDGIFGGNPKWLNPDKLSHEVERTYEKVVNQNIKIEKKSSSNKDQRENDYHNKNESDLPTAKNCNKQRKDESTPINSLHGDLSPDNRKKSGFFFNARHGKNDGSSITTNNAISKSWFLNPYLTPSVASFNESFDSGHIGSQPTTPGDASPGNRSPLKPTISWNSDHAASVNRCSHDGNAEHLTDEKTDQKSSNKSILALTAKDLNEQFWKVLSLKGVKSFSSSGENLSAASRSNSKMAKSKEGSPIASPSASPSNTSRPLLVQAAKDRNNNETNKYFSK